MTSWMNALYISRCFQVVYQTNAVAKRATSKPNKAKVACESGKIVFAANKIELAQYHRTENPPTLLLYQMQKKCRAAILRLPVVKK